MTGPGQDGSSEVYTQEVYHDVPAHLNARRDQGTRIGGAEVRSCDACARGGQGEPGGGASARVGEIQVDAAWARSSGIKGRPLAVYAIIINGGKEADRLLKAASPAAGMVRLHETVMQDGVMKMQHLMALPLQPGAATELKPGRYHLMVMQPKAVFKKGDLLPLTLTFAKAGRVSLEVPVYGLTAKAPD